MFPRELHYILEEGMSDKHNNKVAKEIENSKGWMQVIVQKSQTNTWVVEHEKSWQIELTFLDFYVLKLPLF